MLHPPQDRSVRLRGKSVQVFAVVREQWEKCPRRTPERLQELQEAAEAALAWLDAQVAFAGHARAVEAAWQKSPWY